MVSDVIVDIVNDSSDADVELFNDYWMYLSNIDTILMMQSIEFDAMVWL